MKPRFMALRRSMNAAGEKISEEGLIRFDFRVFLLTFILLLLFVCAVAFRLHGSSIAYWDTVYPAARDDKSGVLISTPKSIRSDEWLVGTPWAFSQFKKDFPVSNINLGANNDPLLNNVPVGHFTTIFKPQNWGYFTLGIERGFSFWWDFKIFGVVTGFFFLLMLLTDNRFWLSLAGASWILFSSFTQWWFSTMMPEMIASFAFLFIGLAYLFLARRRALAACGAVLLLVFSIDFALFFYPAFQVPLFYLAVFLSVGLLATGGRWQLFKNHISSRLPVAFGIGMLVMGVLFLFYRDALDTINAIASTEYPGRRSSPGGETGFERLFSGFSAAPTGELDYPEVWANASETSNFILLFPIVLLAWTRNLFLRIKNSPLVTALLVFTLLMAAWMIIPFPEFLAKASLMSYVPFNRAPLALGLASILVTMIFLAGERRESRDKSLMRFNLVAALAIFATMLWYGYRFNQITEDYLRYRYILLMAVFYGVVSWLLLERRRLVFCLMIMVALTPYILVNPLARGLAPIYENEIVVTAENVEAQRPGALWVSYGDITLPALLKAGGLDLINGARYTPDLELYSRLDEQGQNREAYNRYAHVGFRDPGNIEAPSVIVQTQMDAFDVVVSPCSARMKDLGFDYFVFSYRPAATSIPCLELIAEAGDTGIGFYQRNSGG
ncbi:MAG: DUF7657 domain-containing protein [Thermoleophilia bacterium]